MGLIKTLRDTEPFNHLPDDIFAEIEQASRLKKYPPHAQIFDQHDPPTGFLYVVKSGLVEIIALSPGGVEMVVDHRSEGSFLGGTPVFTEQDYTAGARTVKTTECYLIPAAVLLKAAQRYPQLSEYFTRAIFSRVRRLYADMVSDQTELTSSQMEAYPFQKRLAEIMSSPVATCPPDTPVQEVAERMTRRGISSILVCDAAELLLGIITERDLVVKVLARGGEDCGSATAADVMTPDPACMGPDTFMYEATTFLMEHRLKHLPVVAQGKLVGIVTLQDLMKYRSQKAMLLVTAAKEADSLATLTGLRAEVVKVAKLLIDETRSPFETMEILSYIHHCIQRRCFALVMEEFEARGMTPPDIRYCHFIMGSGGRKEMLLGPDQDNGFVFEDYPDERQAEVEAFFVPFCERLVEAYAAVGYPLCNGKVMANNPFWRGRLQDWQLRVNNWVRVPEPKKVMYSTIFFDFMPLSGDPSLCQQLRDIVYQEVAEFPLFLFYLMQQDYKHKPPLGLLGRFTVEREGEYKGKLSLKQAGSVFIVDCIRMYVLEKQIEATTTLERLERLVQLNIFTPESAEHIQAAFEAFTFLRLRNEIALIDQGLPPSHYLDPNALTGNEQDLLREAFRAASKLQDSTRRHFNVG